ncbi:putative deacetylase LmbE-like domain-containing protein [Aspergillus filifer]
MRSYRLFSALLTFASLSLGQVLNIVAHQDDDLLFLSPDLLHYIQINHEVRTVFLTAGDAGREASYWQDREEGVRTAYALMSDSPNSWAQKDAGIPGHKAPLFELETNPSVSLVFLRLPDGDLEGQGFEVTGGESLQKLWEGKITSIQTVSGSSSYNKDELIDSLVHLISDFHPERVHTLDYVHHYGDGDHSDHHSAAYFVKEALGRYDNDPVFTGYMGYPVVNQPANVLSADLLDKESAFFAYARSDPIVCGSDLACADDAHYPRWLERQHPLDATPIANAGLPQTAGLGVVVALDGTASSGSVGKPLIYEWTQVSGPPVDLIDAETSQPSFTTPHGPDTLVFELVVTSEEMSSSPATVTITTMQYPENIAFRARVTASSSNIGANQTPDKAIDGSTGGFPAAHTHEWATEGGKVGSWLSLSWDGPQIISQVALFDRPNLDDQVLTAALKFDNGNAVEVGDLSNYGLRRLVDIGDRMAQNLTVRITAVSASTIDVGLSEVQVFGRSAD